MQNLTAIDEAVVPTCPLVADSNTLLAQIPEDNNRSSVLDLKDSFFSISLEPDSQYLLALG